MLHYYNYINIVGTKKGTPVIKWINIFGHLPFLTTNLYHSRIALEARHLPHSGWRDNILFKFLNSTLIIKWKLYNLLCALMATFNFTFITEWNRQYSYRKPVCIRCHTWISHLMYTEGLVSYTRFMHYTFLLPFHFLVPLSRCCLHAGSVSLLLNFYSSKLTVFACMSCVIQPNKYVFLGKASIFPDSKNNVAFNSFSINPYHNDGDYTFLSEGKMKVMVLISQYLELTELLRNVCQVWSNLLECVSKLPHCVDVSMI